MYEGDIGYVEETAESDAVMLVAPCQLPYDLPEEPGERMMFDVELARIADCNVMPILSCSGAEVGYICDGHEFVHGLLRLMLPANTLEIVELPHPNDIRFHMAAGIDLQFVEETLNLFSAQFCLHELCRVFSLGDTLEVIAGPFCGETGYVVALHECTIILIVMQPDKTPKEVEVSRFTVQSHLQDHVLSLSPEVAEPHLVPLSGDEALLGDIVQVYCGPYAGQMGTIEWIGADSRVWMFNREKGKGKESSEQDLAPSQLMVAMDVSDLHIDRAPDTLTLSKDKGYNIAVGDTVEVARGQWHHSQGIVKAVDLIKASLDIMCPEDGIQINVPIMFACKFKEHFDHRLLRTGMLLNGTLLPPQLQRCLKSLHNQSFITPVVPCNATPPPSPSPSNADPSGAWSTTPDDIIQTQTPDYGEVPWLFESEFCDFKSFHLGFNVSLGKCVVQTVCPDRFVGQNGPAPSGSVCITVTGHNTGSAIQHLTIPAQYLMPANPTSKNQLCLLGVLIFMKTMVVIS
ncbi:hypothetical protein F5141DRAFT_1065723 [Pisolithus sp. B1]|nr:hypothetical protein F5141DRAFT_1065723 [Pisolithus sp. B1]